MNILAAHNRREFLRSAVELAIGGVASTAMGRQVSKQPVARGPQRVAVIGAGHYHATLAGVLSPNSSEREVLNANAERFVRTIKEGCLDQMIFFGEDMLRTTIREFMAHYHLERNHQGLDNRLLAPVEIIATGVVQKRERLGGLLNYYYRKAA